MARRPLSFIASRVEYLEDRTLLASGFSVGLNFTGTVQSDFLSGSIPDTMGSVGPDHVVELINWAYAVYNKSDGSLVTRIDDDVFWNTALSNGGGGSAANIVDPRIVYDHASGRWFAAALDRLSTPERNILVGVSNTSDPTDGWKAFLIDPDPTDLYFADFPTLGVDADGVYIQTNIFDYQPDGITPDPQFPTTVISVPKADLVAATPTVAGATVFAVLDANVQTNPFRTMQPAVDFGPSDGRAPLLAQAGGSILRNDVLNASGPGSATLTNRVTISVPFNGNPPDAPQPGTTTLIETGASFLRSSVFEQGDSLWAVYAEDVDGRSGIRWLEIDEPTNTVLQTGTLGHPELHFYYPSVAANELGEVVIGFSGSSSTQFASAYAVAGRTDGGTTTFGDVTLLKAGQGSFLPGLSGPVRWGDYSAVALDPSNTRHFWTFQEWADADGDWAMQVTQIDMSQSIPGNSPPVVNNQSFSVAENSAKGTTVDTVIASDPDAGQLLSFAITAGNTNNAFAINASTGQITVNDTNQLDFETIPSFSLTVEVIDNGTPALSDTATVMINLNDVNEPPAVALQNTTTTLPEDTDTGSRLKVADVVVSDDALGTNVLALSGPDAGLFEIDGSQLFLKAGAALDFETDSQLDVTVDVDDGSIGSSPDDTASLAITITDVNEPPTVNDQAFLVDENSPNGTVIGTVSANDPDAGQTLTYAIIAGNESGAFAINTTDGALSVADGSQLDFETDPVLTLTVEVSDNGTPVLSGTALVTINLVDVDTPIDILPDTDPNLINIKKKGKIPVAILSYAGFSAPDLVDVITLTFGRTGDENSLSLHKKTGLPRPKSQDVNGDGFLDLVVDFEKSLAGFQSGDTLGILKGYLNDGSYMEGQDAIQTRQSNGKGNGKGRGNNKAAAGSPTADISTAIPFFSSIDATAPKDSNSANDDVVSNDVELSIVTFPNRNSVEPDSKESSSDDDVDKNLAEGTGPGTANPLEIDELFGDLLSDELLTDVI